MIVHINFLNDIVPSHITSKQTKLQFLGKQRP